MDRIIPSICVFVYSHYYMIHDIIFSFIPCFFRVSFLTSGQDELPPSLPKYFLYY